MKTYRSARVVLEAVEQVLAPKPRLASRGRLPLREIRGARIPESPLDAVAGLLQSSRQYFAVTIYLATGERLPRVASAGSAPRCDSMRVGEGNVGEAAKTGMAKVVPDVSRDPQYFKVFPETRSELVTPIKIGTHVIGVMDLESDRLNTFAYEERVLLHEIATLLARFLSTHGKYLVMKAREAAGEKAHS
ncbi:MAG: GAF domain-containing protein [Acidobacteriia bacterium]|nr:GAF domain-containing protein [Terriglobia bacterium]